MSYERTYPLAYNTPPWQPPLGALEPAQANAACVQWVGSAYNLAEYERIRTRELPDLLARGRQLMGVSTNLGQALSPSQFGKAWSKFARWGAAARGSKSEIDRIYGAWLESVATWLEAAGDLHRRMATALNIPAFWLLPTRASGVRFDSDQGVARVPGEGLTPPVTTDSVGWVARSGWSGPRSDPRGRRGGALPAFTGGPYSVRLGAYQSSGTPSRAKLLEVWKRSQFMSRPMTEVWAGFPATRLATPSVLRAPVWELVPPAVYVDKVWSGRPDDLVAGPRESLFFGHEAIARLANRSAQQVLQNAFETWGTVLVKWSESGLNPLKEDGKQKLRIAGAAIKTAGAAIAGVGTVAANPIVAGVGAVVVLIGELFASVIPVTVRCGTPGHVLHRQLGGFCGPPEPFLMRPPAGCSAGDILAEIDRRGAAGSGSFWGDVKRFLTHPATLAVGVAAIAGTALYAATRKGKRTKP